MGHLRHLWFVVLFVISVNDVILRWRHWSSSLIFYCIENTTCYKFYFIIDCQKGLQSRRSTANDKTSLRRCFSPFLFLNSNAWKCQGGAFRFNWSSCCIFSLRYFFLLFPTPTEYQLGDVIMLLAPIFTSERCISTLPSIWRHHQPWIRHCSPSLNCPHQFACIFKPSFFTSGTQKVSKMVLKHGL